MTTVLEIYEQFDEQVWEDDTLLGMLIRFIEERQKKDTRIMDELSVFLKVAAGLLCPTCHNQMDTCCSTGNPRCDVCDGPCPGCNDGPGPGEDEDTDEDTDEEWDEFPDFMRWSLETDEDTGLTLEETLADRVASSEQRDLP